MMPRRERARLLLRGLAKLIAVIVVAGLVGAGLGFGLSKLSGDDEPAGPAAEATTAVTKATTSTPAAPVETTATAPPTITTTPRPAAAGAGDDIEVTVGVSVLHLASTPSGRARNRARLGVSVTVRNRGSRRLVLPRPSLLAARQRVPTNPAADKGGSRLGPIAAGQTRRATLQFETAGAVTEQLTTQRKARVLIGGRSSALTVTPGSAVSRSGGARSGTTAAP